MSHVPKGFFCLSYYERPVIASCDARDRGLDNDHHVECEWSVCHDGVTVRRIRKPELVVGPVAVGDSAFSALGEVTIVTTDGWRRPHPLPAHPQ
jgi:hypothetical protein